MFALGALVMTMMTTSNVPAMDLAEVADKQPSKMIVIPLDRKQSVSHRNSGPAEWLKATDHAIFKGQAQPGEFYPYQVVVVSSAPVKSLKVEGLSLKNQAGRTIKATCLNLGGVGPDGKVLTKTVRLDQASVQPLWIGVDIPQDAKGKYEGLVKIKGSTWQQATVKIELDVQGAVLKDHGDGDAWRLSRLRWLNSTIGQDRTITKPYVALRYDGLSIRSLTHQIELLPNGMLKQSNSYLDEGGQLHKVPTPYLAEPIVFSIQSPHGDEAIEWGEMRWMSKAADLAEWQTKGKAGDIEVVLKGKWGYDGFLSYDIALKAPKSKELSSIKLVSSIAQRNTTYVAGMGIEGSQLWNRHVFKWDVDKHQDTIWIGDVLNGCSFRFMGGNYRLPLCNIYYPFGKLANPDSWNNQGKGTVTVERLASHSLLTADSGTCRLEAGKPLHFAVDLRLTPVKPIDTNEHWATRYYHTGGLNEKVFDEAKESGFNTLNLHHGNRLNPFINYPYSEEAFPDLLEYIKQVQAKGLRFKIYYTTRELTQNLPELDALYSLNGEVIFPGPGEKVRTVLHPNGPDPWLKEHFDGDFIPAWIQPLDGKLQGRIDLAVITTPESRWNNFYLEGLDYLVKKGKIDGLYIDDSALDRTSMQRARRIFDSQRPSAMIDLHSWNHFNDLAGFACNVLMYVELFPYIDRIWFGEGFDYNRSPDYWLVEMSGLPFGQMGEMLQDGGNPWRGMLFGMTQRLPWSGDPRHLWAFWDKFGMKDTQMLGWWDSRCPVRTDNKDVLATVYKGKGKALIAIASWSPKTEKVMLRIDWEKLRLDPAKAKVQIAKIDGYQDALGVIDLSSPLEISPGKGFLIEVHSRG